MPGIGRGISPFLKRNLASAVAPNAFILSWYNALSVKPSAALTSALNDLTAGMNTDGDWTELDFFALAAGMETQEQALRPLKTTGSATMTNFDNGGGGLVWSVNGWAANTLDVIRTGYNLSTNSVKYTLNSAFIGFYGNTRANTETSASVFSVYYTVDALTQYQSDLIRTTDGTSVTVNCPPLNIDTSGFNSSISKSKTNGNANFPYYIGLKRTGAAASIAFINGSNSSNNTSPSSLIPVGEIPFMGILNNDIATPAQDWTGMESGYGRAGLIGSGSVSQDNTGSRLNTFFTARGLSPYV
nr:hypothetical protein [uncultured Flavobacterium sp.]